MYLTLKIIKFYRALLDQIDQKDRDFQEDADGSVNEAGCQTVRIPDIKLRDSVKGISPAVIKCSIILKYQLGLPTWVIFPVMNTCGRELLG